MGYRGPGPSHSAAFSSETRFAFRRQIVPSKKSRVATDSFKSNVLRVSSTFQVALSPGPLAGPQVPGADRRSAAVRLLDRRWSYVAPKVYIVVPEFCVPRTINVYCKDVNERSA